MLRQVSYRQETYRAVSPYNTKSAALATAQHAEATRIAILKKRGSREQPFILSSIGEFVITLNDPHDVKVVRLKDSRAGVSPTTFTEHICGTPRLEQLSLNQRVRGSNPRAPPNLPNRLAVFRSAATFA